MRERGRPAEGELLEAVADELRLQGYRAYLDPDGASYFDLVVRRGSVVGLVEGKVGNPRRVLVQALRRRAWADWVAVVVDSARAAERLVARTEGARAATVGIWVAADGRARELRAAAHRQDDGAGDPFARHRARLRDALDAIDRGESPPGVGWSGVPREVRRASGGRAFAEWRLDERWSDDPGQPGPEAPPSPASSPATRSGAKRAP